MESEKEVGSKFSGVLYRRATWCEGVKPFFGKSEAAGRDWFATEEKELWIKTLIVTEYLVVQKLK